MSSYKAQAICPYYSKDSKNAVYCEGPVEQSSFSVSFRSRRDFRTHMRSFCCGKYYYCELCRVIDEKYGE